MDRIGLGPGLGVGGQDRVRACTKSRWTGLGPGVGGHGRVRARARSRWTG